MKTIPLTQNQVAVVNDHWFDHLNQWKWKALWNVDTKSFYACREEYDPVTKKRKSIYMHRLVAKTPSGKNFENLEDAIEARKNAEKQYFGDFAFLNTFPQETL